MKNTETKENDIKKNNEIKLIINLFNDKKWELEQNKILLKIMKDEKFFLFKTLIEERKKSISKENIYESGIEAFDYFNEVNSINLQNSPSTSSGCISSPNLPKM